MSCGLRPGTKIGRGQRQRQARDLNNAVKNTRSEDERFGGTSGAKPPMEARVGDRHAACAVALGQTTPPRLRKSCLDSWDVSVLIGEGREGHGLQDVSRTTVNMEVERTYCAWIPESRHFGAA